MLQEIEPYSFHIEYKEQMAEEQDILLCYKKGSVLFQETATGEMEFPTVSQAKKSGRLSDGKECRYLFSVDDMRFFCVIDREIEEFEQYCYEPINKLRHAVPMWRAFAAATGYHIWWWYKKNRFCGSCGETMTHSETERAMCCPSCGNVAYPMIAPSVIVAVKNNNRLLLTRYQPSHNPYSHYALIAGYVEVGETPEDTVRREVMEEVGLTVKNIQYYKSQPWSFTGALLLGFFCEADGDITVTLDRTELSEAVWMEREDMPDRSNDISLTSEMMEQFRLGKF